MNVEILVWHDFDPSVEMMPKQIQIECNPDSIESDIELYLYQNGYYDKANITWQIV